MRFIGRVTQFTPGACKEQLLLEKELFALEKKLNIYNILAILFLITIVGLPISLLIVLLGWPTHKKVKKIKQQIEQIQIENAPSKR